MLRDCEKMSLASAAGWFVILAAPPHVRTWEFIDWLVKPLEARGYPVDHDRIEQMRPLRQVKRGRRR